MLFVIDLMFFFINSRNLSLLISFNSPFWLLIIYLFYKYTSTIIAFFDSLITYSSTFGLQSIISLSSTVF